MPARPRRARGRYAHVHARRYRLFCDRLVAARVAAGLTQVEVAKALHQRQSFVSKCESGARRIDVIELERFAALYKKTNARG